MTVGLRSRESVDERLCVWCCFAEHVFANVHSLARVHAWSLGCSLAHAHTHTHSLSLSLSLCCAEAYLPGDYVKYTNNTGFFDVEHMRNTPQAFSHFTFVESKGEVLICDIQGVSDIYTDPAIHTADKKHYGTGNLGHRGMALFLYSHECNFVCRQVRTRLLLLWFARDLCAPRSWSA
jgi:Alpha-kinase family